MSAPPHHDVGIDTRSQLNKLDWPKILGWRPDADVTFAGRYFLQTPPGGSWLWADGKETQGISQLNSKLRYVLPIQGPGPGPNPNYNTNSWWRLEGLNPVDGSTPEDETTVRGWGAADATAICDHIAKVVSNGDLQFPDPNHVIVYLDIETPGLTLSPDYWYGWASTVFMYVIESLETPFYPGLYCPTMPNPAYGRDPLNHRLPSSIAAAPYSDVQTGLTAPPNEIESICYGIWASNPYVPQPPKVDRFTQGWKPDWGSPPNNRFDVWQQTVGLGPLTWHSAIPVRMWQYVALVDGSTDPTIQAFNKLNVDFNETSDSDVVNFMLTIPS
jgi:hypothetical protein